MKHQSDLLIKGDFDGSERQFSVLPIEPTRSKQYVQHRYSIDSLTYLVKTVSVRTPSSQSLLHLGVLTNTLSCASQFQNDQDQLQDLLTYIKNYDDAGYLDTRRRQASSASSRQQASLSSDYKSAWSHDCSTDLPL